MGYTGAINVPPSGSSLDPALAPVLDRLPDPFFAVDAAWRYVYVNTHAAALLGVAPDELVGQVLWDVEPEARGTTLWDEFHRAMSSREVRAFEAYSSAWRMWADVKAFPFEDGLAVHLRDISERRRAEARARHLQEVTTQLGAARTPAEVVDVVLSHALVAVGAYAGGVLRVSPGGDRAETIDQRGYPADLAEAWRDVPLDLDVPLARAVRDNEPQFLDRETLAARFPAFVGSVQAASRSLAVLPLGTPERVFGALTLSFPERHAFDAGERAFLVSLAGQLAQALDRAALHADTAAARERAAFLSEAGELLSGSLDEAETVEQLARLTVSRFSDWCGVYLPNEAGELELRGIAHQDEGRLALLRRLLELYPLRDEPGEVTYQVFRTGEPVFVPVITDDMYDAIDDERRREMARGLQLRSVMTVPLVARGEVRGVLSVASIREGHPYVPEDFALLQDLARRAAVAFDNARLYGDLERRVTSRTADLNRTVDELRRSNTELERFAYVASHDLQEPLRAVSSFTSLLERRLAGTLDAQTERYLGFVVQGAARMKALVDDLLAFSRLGGERTAMRDLAVGEPLQEALARLAPHLRESAAEVEAGDLPRVHGDPVQLAQLFQHLVGNAVKFRRAGTEPRVRVEAAPDGPFWRFTVLDNGIGVEPRYRERIFEIFQRLHPRDAYEGTGMGLALCRKIVEHHGGAIWVETAPNGGSAFRFTLPGAKSPPPAEAPGA